MTVMLDLKSLYEVDEYQWLEETINLLKYQRFHQLDLENLIEELTDLGNDKKRAVESLLEQIIRHLLMYQYWQQELQFNAGHWSAEIYSFRRQLNRQLTTNLRNHLIGEFSLIYQDALGYVKRKTQFSVDFPPLCPYTIEQLLDIDYLP
ncbi:MAG TPA: DUF29 domain-containing protein [Allocoleopsis sp.]